MAFLLRWWWLMLLGPLAALASAYLLSSLRDESESVYQSTAVLLVIGDGGASERVTTTYARLIELRPVFTEVRTRLNLPFTVEELDEKTTVTNEFNSQLIEVGVEDTDPLRAANIANTITAVFLERIDAQVGRTGTATVVSTAIPPSEPESDLGGVVFLVAVMLGALVAASIGVGIDWLGREIEA